MLISTTLHRLGTLISMQSRCRQRKKPFCEHPWSAYKSDLQRSLLTLTLIIIIIIIFVCRVGAEYKHTGAPRYKSRPGYKSMVL